MLELAHVAVAHVADLLDEPADLRRREAGGHFVHQQHARLAGERSGELERLLLLQRQRVGAIGEARFQPGIRDEVPRLGQGLARIEPVLAEHQRHRDVLLHGEVAERARDLVGASDA